MSDTFTLYKLVMNKLVMEYRIFKFVRTFASVVSIFLRMLSAVFYLLSVWSLDSSL